MGDNRNSSQLNSTQSGSTASTSSTNRGANNSNRNSHSVINIPSGNKEPMLNNINYNPTNDAVELTYERIKEIYKNTFLGS
ncbi:hypothetical protein Xmau_03460 [Xenorhabdus mauleonii]|uniref:Uncharacterized protein n=1 Tax=Xenorhabdus mauleonii TaxID=351675 RepID=A0A1I3VRF1_9GAMM|nr:hypothetical protein [Xenorhabdus mauleonii]PHM38402.1 hypothetical protein Xmau_03460 [Xenorhabdus mauleonii]SFJ97740.1 hypothetical protein SAMN05421680_12231 [Xenorhabdus mauleonii]